MYVRINILMIIPKNAGAFHKKQCAFTMEGSLAQRGHHAAIANDVPEGKGQRTSPSGRGSHRVPWRQAGPHATPAGVSLPLADTQQADGGHCCPSLVM